MPNYVVTIKYKFVTDSKDSPIRVFEYDAENVADHFAATDSAVSAFFKDGTISAMDLQEDSLSSGARFCSQEEWFERKKARENQIKIEGESSSQDPKRRV